MREVRILERTKEDFKDLEAYLVRNELVDEKRIWFAGYDNYRKATNNAIAGNLLYGNKKLIIVTINGNDINYLRNTKNGFKLSVIGAVDEKNKVTSLRHIMYPTVDMNVKDGEFYSIKVMKHKESIKEFKQLIK